MTLPYRILVLDDDERALSGVVELLYEAGHQVTGAPTYEAAKQLLSVSPFDLLISDVRLRSFNGLNLIMQARADHPEMAVMIMTGYDDPLIDLEAHRYNAPLVKKPIRPQEFLKLVASTLVHVRRVRRWPRKRVAGGFRVTAAGRPAAVVDVSYGGLRLEMREGPAPAGRFDVEIAGIGLHLEAESVWTDALPTVHRSVCGASLAENETAAARTWRDIVDRLSASA
ncbi:MAG: response regulator [Vicinamibacterales bacterium]